MPFGPKVPIGVFWTARAIVLYLLEGSDIGGALLRACRFIIIAIIEKHARASDIENKILANRILLLLSMDFRDVPFPGKEAPPSFDLEPDCFDGI